MSTGAIIAIAVVVVLILIALLVLLPRMRAKAAERKRQQEHQEEQRRLERERREAAEHHRSASETQLKRAELAEQEAKKQRAEAEIHAKRAELHEEGLADEDLQSGGANGRVAPGALDDRPRETVRDSDPGAIDGDGDGVRPVAGGRAHEPVRDGEPDDGPASERDGVSFSADRDDQEFDRGHEAGQAADEPRPGARRMTPEDEPGSGDEPGRAPLR